MAQGAPPVEMPRGMYDGQLDDKGRLKMPAVFQQYIKALPEQILFVTSLDRRTAQIYPMSVWRSNEKFLEDYQEDPDTAYDVAFNANDLGANAEMDAQGRILFSIELRRSLGIENAPVHLYAYKAHIEVMSEQVYQQQKQQATQSPTQKVRTLQKKGLQ